MPALTMTTLLLLSSQAAAPSQHPEKTCPCSTACTCGCNQEKGCTCGNPPTRVPKPRPHYSRNFGVDPARLSREAGYWLNGQKVTRAQVWARIAQRQPQPTITQRTIPDRTRLLRLTVFGDSTQCQRIQADLKQHPALLPWRGRLVLQTYPPNHWVAQEYGFQVKDNPTLYLQTPDGTVLHRQDDYTGGPEELARALRKADPAYQPDKDPDLRKRIPSNIPLGLVFLGLAVIGLLILLACDR